MFYIYFNLGVQGAYISKLKLSGLNFILSMPTTTNHFFWMCSSSLVTTTHIPTLTAFNASVAQLFLVVPMRISVQAFTELGILPKHVTPFSSCVSNVISCNEDLDVPFLPA